MPWAPGQSGNPDGRPVGTTKNPFSEMLRLAVSDSKDDKTELRHIAEALVKKAKEGDVPAIKEVADRLDGKVPQGVAFGAEGGLSRMTLEWLKPSE